MKINKIELIEKDRINKEIKKVLKKEKKFNDTFEIFKKSILIEDNVYLKVRESNSFKIIKGSECDSKIYWKAYIRDSKYARMIRVIFFIKDGILFIIEVYHKDNQTECTKKLLKQYCEF